MICNASVDPRIEFGNQSDRNKFHPGRAINHSALYRKYSYSFETTQCRFVISIPLLECWLSDSGFEVVRGQQVRIQQTSEFLQSLHLQLTHTLL